MSLHFEKKLTGAICVKGIKDTTKRIKKTNARESVQTARLKALANTVFILQKNFKKYKKITCINLTDNIYLNSL